MMEQHTSQFVLPLRGQELGRRQQPLLRPAVLRRTQSNTSLPPASILAGNGSNHGSNGNNHQISPPSPAPASPAPSASALDEYASPLKYPQYNPHHYPSPSSNSSAANLRPFTSVTNSNNNNEQQQQQHLLQQSSPPSSYSQSYQPSTPPTLSFPLSPLELASLPPVGTALPREEWKPDQDAPICDARSCATAFSLLNRRHHCRSCGGVFCRRCAPHLAPLLPPGNSNQDDATLERICEGCFSTLLIHPQSSTNSSSTSLASFPPHHSNSSGRPRASNLSRSASASVTVTAPVTPASSPPPVSFLPNLSIFGRSASYSTTNTTSASNNSTTTAAPATKSQVAPGQVVNNNNNNNNSKQQKQQQQQHQKQRSVSSSFESSAPTPSSSTQSDSSSSLETNTTTPPTAYNKNSNYVVSPQSIRSADNVIDDHDNDDDPQQQQPRTGTLPCKVNQSSQHGKNEVITNVASSLHPVGSYGWHWSTF